MQTRNLRVSVVKTDRVQHNGVPYIKGNVVLNAPDDRYNQNYKFLYSVTLLPSDVKEYANLAVVFHELRGKEICGQKLSGEDKDKMHNAHKKMRELHWRVALQKFGG